MDIEILLGICITFLGLGFILYLTIRSRRIIQKISSPKKETTTRVILKELQNGD
ncbi:hypothetical protein ACFL4L_05485 [bacterium]